MAAYDLIREAQEEKHKEVYGDKDAAIGEILEFLRINAKDIAYKIRTCDTDYISYSPDIRTSIHQHIVPEIRDAVRKATGIKLELILFDFRISLIISCR